MKRRRRRVQARGGDGCRLMSLDEKLEGIVLDAMEGPVPADILMSILVEPWVVEVEADVEPVIVELDG